jgi:hypothetical protein
MLRNPAENLHRPGISDKCSTTARTTWLDFCEKSANADLFKRFLRRMVGMPLASCRSAGYVRLPSKRGFPAGGFGKIESLFKTPIRYFVMAYIRTSLYMCAFGDMAHPSDESTGFKMTQAKRRLEANRRIAEAIDANLSSLNLADPALTALPVRIQALPFLPALTFQQISFARYPHGLAI